MWRCINFKRLTVSNRKKNVLSFFVGREGEKNEIKLVIIKMNKALTNDRNYNYYFF